MLLVVKCIFWLGLVFFLIGGRGAEPPSVGPARASVKEARDNRAAPTKGQSAAGGRGGALSALADQAAEKLAGAARDQCLAHPVDCLLAAERFGLGPLEAEPARR